MERFIMFADIVGSTTLYERLGDEVATELVTRALELAGETVVAGGGRVVDEKGDEVLCTFDSAEDALRGVRAVHRAAEAYSHRRSEIVVFRIGLNFGEMVETPDNIYGDAVNVGSRLASEAKARQTVLSESVVKRCPPDFLSRLREIGEIWIKGKQGTHRIFELLEANPETEITEVTDHNRLSERAFRLTLRLNHQEIRLNPTSPKLVIGRSETCDLTVNHPTVSRHHAEIQYRNGRYVFIDLSTNGSQVVMDGRPRRLLRNTMELAGSGQIALGRTAGSTQFIVRYDVDA